MYVDFSLYVLFFCICVRLCVSFCVCDVFAYMCEILYVSVSFYV